MVNGYVRVTVVAISVMLLSSHVACSTDDVTDLLRGPPRVETRPNLLDSYLPAAMQVIAHLTELMKYDLKPQNNRPTPSTTTTQRPTSSHRPAILAPSDPPGPTAYFAKEVSYEEYLHRLQHPSTGDYFERYLPGGSRSLDLNLEEADRRTNTTRSYSNVYGNLPNDLKNYISKSVVDVLHLVNRIDDDFSPEDVDVQVDHFQKEYEDDTDFRYALMKQKRMPPIKAYVSLLSLYDLLNKESKAQGLNKYGGYHQHVLVELVKASEGSSSEQLLFILSKIIEKRDTKQPSLLKKLEGMVADLQQENSYINDALLYIPPLAFAL